MPSLPEQRAITRILRSVQTAREARRRELDLERERKAALMQHLFTHGTRGEARKQTEIGEMPESWQIISISQVCDCLDHKRVPVKLSDRNARPGTVPYYGASGQAGWIDDYLFDEPLLLVAEDGENLETRKLPIAYSIDGKSWVNNHAHVLRAIGINQDFLEQFLVIADLSAVIGGATRPKLNKAQLMDFAIPLPPDDEQDRIAHCIKALTNRIVALAREADLLDELFRALLEELMSGRLSAVPLIDG